MSRKLSRIRLTKINTSVFFVAERNRADGEAKTLSDIAKEFERYEDTFADEILPQSLTDKHHSGKTFAEILENKQFETDDLPFAL